MTLPVALKDKKERGIALFAEAQRILTDPNATPEELQKVDGIIAEADGLTADLFKLDSVTKAFEKLNTLTREESKPDGSKFNSLGEYLTRVYQAGRSGMSKVDPRLRYFEDEKPAGVEAKDLGESIGSTGGFLVPVELQTQVYGVTAEQSVFMQRATRIPMRRRQIQIPVLDQTDTTAGVAHWFGGIQAYWVAEHAEKPQSEPSWREVTLTAHEMVGYARASNILVEDAAISLEAFFNGPLGFNGAMTWLMDWATINGTGVGMPLGWMNSGATIVVDRATSGQITYPDLLNMLQRFLSTGGQGVWYVTQSALASLAQMTGPSGNPSYVWMNDAQNGIPGRLLGMPVVFTEKMPALGQQGDIALVNPPYYLVGDRQAVTIESTQFDRWRYNQTSWRAVARMDGQPWMNSPLTLMDGTSQLSPFVVLGDTST